MTTDFIWAVNRLFFVASLQKANTFLSAPGPSGASPQRGCLPAEDDGVFCLFGETTSG
ncbi:hypothetical protein [Tatumella punctata]|uniref:hypothetical protein n=1 Tax=Tatumella punctata TaxID=399969 RepID=UPI0036DE98D6